MEPTLTTTIKLTEEHSECGSTPPLGLNTLERTKIMMNYLKNIAKPLYNSLRYIVKSNLSKIKIKKILSNTKIIRLEVGAGNKSGGTNWITIDMKPNCDIYWDLRNGIPFPSGSVSNIYSSHFFEHLTYKQSQVFLNECLRVLKVNGVFSICVPNAKIYIEAYINKKQLGLNYRGYEPAMNNTTLIDYVNYTAYMDGQHNYMFDEENLIFILKSIGFYDVKLRKFDPSTDMIERDFESIYAEGIKK